MKKTRIIALLLCLAMVFAVTACGKKTLEQYVKDDPEVSQQIQDMATSSGLSVEFNGNDVIYTYDFATVGNISEDAVTSQAVYDQLDSALTQASGTFSGLCQQLEEETKISGIRMIVNYTYGDKVIISKTFNASGME